MCYLLYFLVLFSCFALFYYSYHSSFNRALFLISFIPFYTILLIQFLFFLSFLIHLSFPDSFNLTIYVIPLFYFLFLQYTSYPFYYVPDIIPITSVTSLHLFIIGKMKSESSQSFLLLQNQFGSSTRRPSSGTYSNTVGLSNMCLLCDKVVHNMESKYTHTCICMYECMYIHTITYIHIYAHTHVYTCYVMFLLCVHVHVHIYLHTNKHLHTNLSFIIFIPISINSISSQSPLFIQLPVII